MPLGTASPSFSCTDCGSPSIKAEGALTATTPVHCDGCGKYLGDWDMFVGELEDKIRRFSSLIKNKKFEHRLCA